jgi:hypothetical protein
MNLFALSGKNTVREEVTSYARRGLYALVAALICIAPLSAQWRTGYYSSNGFDGGLPAKNIYYAPFTHIVHYNSFPVVSGSSVTLNTTYYGVAADAPTLIAGAHAAGVRVLLCVGIGGADNAMAVATDSTHLASFVSAVMQFVSVNQYDGVDIDWEGGTYAPSQYPTQFANMMSSFRTQLNGYTSVLGGRGQLTGYFGPESLAAATQANLDQINVSCYDDFGWSFSLVWHNAAVDDPLNQGQSRSCQNVVNVFVNAGVSKSKIGAGIPFYGYRWIGGKDASGQGALYPGQKLTTAATYDSSNYAALVANSTLYQTQYQHWDDSAKVPYLSIDNAGNANDMFITYENPTSISNKWTFVLQNQIGGIMVYPMGGDWTAQGSTVAAQHPLSEALRLAAGGQSSTPPPPPPTTQAPTITSATPLPSGSLGKQYSTALAASGTTPIAWSVASGNLPPGLSLTTSNGAISGAPSSAGTWSFTAKASNSAGTNTKSVSLSVSAPATTFTVKGQISISYSTLSSVKVTASNGQSTSTDSSGNYSLSLPSGFTGSITPSRYGYSFQPSQASVTSLSSNTTVNFSARRTR